MKDNASVNVKVCCLLDGSCLNSDIILTQCIERECDSSQAEALKEAQGDEHWDVDGEGHHNAEN